MSESINQIFTKIIAINLIVIGAFAVGSPLIAIYMKNHKDKEKLKKLYIYLTGGILLIILGMFMYK